MQLQLKLLSKLDYGHKGEFIVKGPNKCEIQISKEKNTSITEFATTLLHELLHFWVTILQTHGLKESIRKEHKFINNVVPFILRKLVKSFT